jgi:hypothetical protein
MPLTAGFSVTCPDTIADNDREQENREIVALSPLHAPPFALFFCTWSSTALPELGPRD